MDALMLDGNAVAGLLQEVFAVEMTTAIETCNACGATNEVGALHVFRGAGIVMRCPHAGASHRLGSSPLTARPELQRPPPGADERLCASLRPRRSPRAFGTGLHGPARQAARLAASARSQASRRR